MKIQSWLTYIFLVVVCLTTACASLFNVPLDAEGAYESKQYHIASQLFMEKYEAEKDLLKQAAIAYKIAESYRLSNKTQEAEKWYKKATTYSTDPLITVKYAQMLKSNGKYKEAMRLFKEYGLNNPSDKTRATREIQACKQALKWQNDTTNYTLFPLVTLNTPQSDFSPVLYEDNQVVFTSSRQTAMGDKIYGWTGEKHTDLFIATNKDELTFDLPIQFGDSINTNFNEGTATFDGTYTKVYFTACGSDKEDNDYCRIYTSERKKNNKWSLPELVSLFEIDTINVGQPFLTPDGKSLYFAADAPDGYGDKDLYVTNLTLDGFWSEPKNLGPEINTENYEGFPYVGPDGKLYFASNGHLGMGGLDIFYATRKGKNWVAPQNIAAPINSSADDFGLVMFPFIDPALLDSIEAIGYFTSSREGGQGNDDIYKFVLSVPKEEPIDTTPIVSIPTIDTTEKVVVMPEPVKPVPVKPITPTKPIQPPKPVITYTLKGKILQKQLLDPNNPASKQTGSLPIREAVVEVLGVSANSSLAKRLITNNKGEFSVTVEPESIYKVTATKNGFFTKSQNATNKGKQPTSGKNEVIIYTELVLDKIFKQREITLDNIYYDLDASNIREDAKPTLDKLATLLFENPNIRIELGSHTDARGSDTYNSRLSQERAQSVVNYLVSKGISVQRVIAKGYGETRLVNGCKDGVDCSEEEHQQNRRTTFKVL